MKRKRKSNWRNKRERRKRLLKSENGLKGRKRKGKDKKRSKRKLQERKMKKRRKPNVRQSSKMRQKSSSLCSRDCFSVLNPEQSRRRQTPLWTIFHLRSLLMPPSQQATTVSARWTQPSWAILSR